MDLPWTEYKGRLLKRPRELCRNGGTPWNGRDGSRDYELPSTPSPLGCSHLAWPSDSGIMRS